MIEELFHIGSLSISPFGLTLVIAFLAAYQQLRSGMRTLSVGSEEDASAILFSAAIGGLVGGKAYYAVLYGDWKLLISRSGIVFYGSLIGGAAVVLIVMRLRRLPLWRISDATAPSLALGYSVGRVGCLVVGDDYGIPTTLPWGMTFPVGPISTRAADLQRHFDIEIPAGFSASDQVPVHPTQIYETLIAGAIFLLGRNLLKRGPRPGSVALTVIGLLSVERFLVEFLRAKDDRWIGSMTIAQGISVVILVLVVVLWVVRRPREPLPT